MKILYIAVLLIALVFAQERICRFGTQWRATYFQWTNSAVSGIYFNRTFDGVAGNVRDEFFLNDDAGILSRYEVLYKYDVQEMYIIVNGTQCVKSKMANRTADLDFARCLPVSLTVRDQHKIADLDVELVTAPLEVAGYVRFIGLKLEEGQMDANSTDLVYDTPISSDIVLIDVENRTWTTIHSEWYNYEKLEDADFAGLFDLPADLNCVEQQ